MLGKVAITGGTYRGRELKTPASAATHPMGAREKLALFNSLTPYLAEARVLDCYAGTGALGFEALSRGAASVIFVESDQKAARIIAENAKILGVQAEIIRGKAENISLTRKFDLIFIDPPYDKFDSAEFSHLENLLAPGGVLALSHPASADPTNIFQHLTLKSTKSYAAAQISLFNHKH